ncbi:MAG: menaquinone biosynthetic enzyme MqnA/MqnD family protein [Chthoniobacterales bacterium]
MSAPNDLPPARVGCVRYRNALPLIHGWPGPVIFDHPSVLCRQLAAGELDVALVSSFEYLRNPIYVVVDGVAIGSDGPVYSVVLVHVGALEQLREIVIDPASCTSINLLRCLLAHRGMTVGLVETGEISARRGRLIIGDQAIRFRAETGERYQFLDLGAEWKDQIARPFVYALWLIRPDFAEKKEIGQALRSLGESNRFQLEAIVSTQPASEREFYEFYFRKCLRFTFGETEKEGFQRFAELCAAQNLLPGVPPAPDLV